MPKGLVSIPKPPSPVPQSPMSLIGVMSPFVPFPRLPFPAGQVADLRR